MGYLIALLIFLTIEGIAFAVYLILGLLKNGKKKENGDDLNATEKQKRT